MRVLAFGEILWDIINGVEHLGGAPFNFAAHMAQAGNQSYIISKLGKDSLGQKALAGILKFGVNDSLIGWDAERPTGTVDVMLNNGQPDYTIQENVAYDFIQAEDTLALLERQAFDIFYFGSLSQRNPACAKSLWRILNAGNFTHIFYDVNLRKSGYTDSIIKNSLRECTIFKLNIDEVKVISEVLIGTNLAAEALCKCIKILYPNVKIIIVTAAAEGCYLSVNDKFIQIKGTPVKVVDAVGAGDSFSAAFMHIYGHTLDCVRAATVANKVGAFVASHAGPIPKYSEEIKTLLKPDEKKKIA
jgi:fructokinase